jgi:nitroreductase
MRANDTDNATQTDIIQTIYARRAVRRYKDQSVERGMIEKILDAGRMAPSAMNKQSWKFYILTQKETIKDFSREITRIVAKELIKSGPIGIIKLVVGAFSTIHITDILKHPDPVFYHAPVVIFVTAPRNNEWAALDIGMCCQNIMLAAKALGLDTCPIGVGKYVEHTPSFPRLHIPFSEQVHLAIALGYGDETPVTHKRRTDNVLFIDQ